MSIFWWLSPWAGSGGKKWIDERLLSSSIDGEVLGFDSWAVLDGFMNMVYFGLLDFRGFTADSMVHHNRCFGWSRPLGGGVGLLRLCSVEWRVLGSETWAIHSTRCEWLPPLLPLTRLDPNQFW